MSKVKVQTIPQDAKEVLPKTLSELLELMSSGDNCGTLIIGGEVPLVITMARGPDATPFAALLNAHGLIDGEKLHQMVTEKRGEA